MASSLVDIVRTPAEEEGQARPDDCILYRCTALDHYCDCVVAPCRMVCAAFPHQQTTYPSFYPYTMFPFFPSGHAHRENSLRLGHLKSETGYFEPMWFAGIQKQPRYLGYEEPVSQAKPRCPECHDLPCELEQIGCAKMKALLDIENQKFRTAFEELQLRCRPDSLKLLTLRTTEILQKYAPSPCTKSVLEVAVKRKPWVPFDVPHDIIFWSDFGNIEELQSVRARYNYLKSTHVLIKQKCKETHSLNQELRHLRYICTKNSVPECLEMEIASYLMRN